MPDLVQLRGLRVLAYCGALAHEQERRQPFDIDIDLEADQSIPGLTDDLSDAVDYTPICSEILEIADKERFSLIEKMAQRIVDAIFKIDTKIDAVTITLRKLNVPVEANIQSAAVKIRRERK